MNDLVWEVPVMKRRSSVGIDLKIWREEEMNMKGDKICKSKLHEER
jgi:hypothetical protein